MQNNVVASCSDLQDAMWRLKAHDDGDSSPYPDRPKTADCVYFLRTGICGYGSNCRYNHPNYNGQANRDGGELPERIGQPDCQYFLKTGTCKFGTACKYHHPLDRHDARPVALNIMGLPLRQDEKSCSYYMRNGTCKFGIACKFNHPQPATMGAAFPAATGAPANGSLGSSMIHSPSVPLFGGLSTWPLARTPYISSPQMQGFPAYMPVIYAPSQGTMPVQQGWSTYMGTMSQNLLPTDVLGPTQISGTKPYAQSGSSATANLPERPNQPECQYYMKTGSCKYGTACKYHHPKGNSTSSLTLGPFGLPLRPGRAVCMSYSTYGSCRYGSACKFDHPLVGYYNYPVPALPGPHPSAFFPPVQYSPLPATLTAAEDASPTKTSALPVRLVKPVEANVADPIDSRPPQLQEISPSSHTEPSSED